ncbi:SYF2 splicing factor-domain-containing protein [Lipomyces arxii]|uniref:SYF2 splicing factor-domain-containing protein n=1 Tax=Lipomyces arxii TaxID=56418 RepID=UPI0034CDB7A6
MSDTQKDEKSREREKKLKELRRRLTESSSKNQQELFAEHRRHKQDSVATARLERKQADAELELAKVDAAEAGEEFERKRAWDWTIEESEKWDERVEKKSRAKAAAVFTDFGDAAAKAYERELRDFKPDMEAYLDQKAKALQREGRLVEGEGQVVEVQDSAYGDLNSLEFTSNKPPQAAIDRLAESIHKADEQRMKKKAKKPKDEADVMSINDRNKHFNAKLSRYYDKYTKEIRDSFERGTAL